jgi:hypothetical protein
MSSCIDCGEERAEVCSWCVDENAANAANDARKRAILFERAAVVAWLRVRAAGFAAQAAQHFADGALAVCTAASAIESQVTFAADAIERGEHTEVSDG